MAVGTAGVDAIHRIRWRVCRPILGGVLDDDVGQAAKEGGRRLVALVRREHVEALKVGGEGRRQERRPGVGVDRILDGVTRPGKSRAALGKLLGREAVERGNCGIPKNLEALVRGNRSDVGDAAQLDEGRVCSGHVVRNGNQVAEGEDSGSRGRRMMNPRKEVVADGGENLLLSLIFRRRNESWRSSRSEKNGASSTYRADSKGESVVIAGSAKPQKRKGLTRQHKSTREMTIEGQFSFNGIVDTQQLRKVNRASPWRFGRFDALRDVEMWGLNQSVAVYN